MGIESPKVYLAGLGVFRPDAIAYGASLQVSCAKRGLKGLYPLDKQRGAGRTRDDVGRDFKGNAGMIERARAIVADISPFRGANIDPGTAWEIGCGFAVLACAVRLSN